MPYPVLTGILALLLATLTGGAGAFQPFFDEKASTRAIPQEPELTDLDLEILTLCGGWGAHVEARDFERMLMKKENKAAVERMRKALGSRIYGKTGDRDEFVRQLRRVWFEQKGFQHVFCGEPGRGKDLGGLHYAARFWQAQDEGWAGYRKLNKKANQRPLEKCRGRYLQEKAAEPIYAVSIEFKNPSNPRNEVKCLGSYNRKMSAEDILIAGTLAFKQANKRVGKNSKEACLFETRRPDVPTHYSKLVIKQRALRTFYPMPEKKPYCRKNKRDFKACLCSRL